MKRGEIWWASFQSSKGGEMKKGRPVVIASNNAANRYLNRVQVVPITSSVERLYPCESPVRIGKTGSKAMADQLATISKSRLSRKIGRVTIAELKGIETAIRIQLDLERP
jgi:mRNA interferase MazF